MGSFSTNRGRTFGFARRKASTRPVSTCSFQSIGWKSIALDTESGWEYAEAGPVMRAIDQVGLLDPADRSPVALVGLSAGASMAALLARAIALNAAPS